MKAKSLSDTEFKKLVTEISKPLDPIKEIEVETDEEAEQVIDQLKANLAPRADWATRYEGINTAMQYLKGGIQYFPKGNFAPLSPFINSLLTDLRPGCIKHSLVFVSALAQSLKLDFAPLVKKYYSIFSKLIIHTNATIANSTHIALLEIFKNVTSPKVASDYLKNFQSPEPAYRQLAAELCQIVIETWPSKYSAQMKDEITKALDILGADSIEEISEPANEALKLLGQEPEIQSPRGRLRKTTTLQINLIAVKSAKKSQQVVSPVAAKAASKRGRSSQRKTESIHTPTKSIPASSFTETQEISEISQIDDIQPSIEEISQIQNEPPSPPRVEDQSDDEERPPSDKQVQEQKINESILSKSTRSSARETPKQNLEALLKPESDKSARQLQQLLSYQIQNNDFSEINEFAERIGLAIKIAAEQRRTPSLWQPILAGLLSEIPEELLDYSLPIIGTLGYDKSILGLFVRTYGAEKILEQLQSAKGREKSPYAMPLLISFADSKTRLGLDEDSKELCNDILAVNQRNNATERVRKYVESLSPPLKLDEMLTAASNAILDGQDPTGIARKINSDIDVLVKEAREAEKLALNDDDQKSDMINPLKKAYQSIENTGDRILPTALDGSDEQARAACLFITEIATHTPRALSLAPAIVPILTKASAGCAWEKEAFDAARAMMGDVKSMATLFAVIERFPETQLFGLTVLETFFKASPPPRIVPLQKAVTQKLSQLAEAGGDPEVRRAVVRIFAEFQTKVPSVFKRQLRKLPVAMQRLVVLTAIKNNE